MKKKITVKYGIQKVFEKKHQYRKAFSYLCWGNILNLSAVYVIQGTSSWERILSECLLA